MKKIITLFTVAALLLCCMACFASCSGGNVGTAPELDFDDAQEALEDEGYTVNVSEDSDEGPAEQTLYAHKYDDGDSVSLTIIECKDSTLAKLTFDTLKLQYEMRIKNYENQIKMLERLLDKYDDDYNSDEIDEMEDEVKELKKSLEKMKEDYTFGIKGKIVWYGDNEAAKDSK